MKLNLACGRDIKTGYINLDIEPLRGVDMVYDITKLPLPFETNYFDEIIAFSIIEHIPNYMDLLGELHRILKPKAILKIRVPHFTSPTSYKDPTHVNLFSYGTFDFFVKKKHYYTAWKFSKIKKRFVFGKRVQFWNYLIEAIANKYPRVYENTPLRIFPCLTVYSELVK